MDKTLANKAAALYCQATRATTMGEYLEKQQMAVFYERLAKVCKQEK